MTLLKCSIVCLLVNINVFLLDEQVENDQLSLSLYMRQRVVIFTSVFNISFCGLITSIFAWVSLFALNPLMNYAYSLDWLPSRIFAILFISISVNTFVLLIALQLFKSSSLPFLQGSMTDCFWIFILYLYSVVRGIVE